MIRVENSLLGTKENTDNQISIIGSAPLGNPFKIGAQNVIDRSFILDKAGVQRAYQSWLAAQLSMENPVVIQALDEIAWAVMDGKDVTLKCTCGSEHCHGFILKHILEDKIYETQ